MEAESEDPEATTEEEMRADLAALKKAFNDRERIPRHSAAWEKAIEREGRAVARVRRWVSRPEDGV